MVAEMKDSLTEVERMNKELYKGAKAPMAGRSFSSVEPVEEVDSPEHEPPAEFSTKSIQARRARLQAIADLDKKKREAESQVSVSTLPLRRGSAGDQGDQGRAHTPEEEPHHGKGRKRPASAPKAQSTAKRGQTHCTGFQ